jgi:hypothetical protein
MLALFLLLHPCPLLTTARIVRAGDDLGELAIEFTERHGLDMSYVNILEGMLRAQMAVRTLVTLCITLFIYI